MNRMIKYAAVAGVAGVLAVGMTAPSHADNGRNTAAAIGFGAGALVGAAAASAATHGPYYSRGYHAPGYAYGPAYGYAYEPEYAPGYGSYAYAPRAYAPRGDWSGSCSNQGSYGQGADYANCY